MKTALIIPSMNAGDLWKQVLAALNAQTRQPSRKILLDCQSEDNTADLARQNGFEVHTILRRNFNHGLTRQHGAELANDCDILIYMTQDAVPADPRALEELISEFKNPDVGAAYGRQLPRKDAATIEAFTRHHSYPPSSRVKTMKDIPEFGLKTAFCSDSFAAYRKEAHATAGGFPKTGFGEDMFMAGKMLLAGYAVAYCSEARVVHSHCATLSESFQRGLHIGRFHKEFRWLKETFGSAQQAGDHYIRDGVFFLKKENPFLIPLFIIQSGIKYIGFLTGRYTP